jgi:hypothetical protein
MVFCRPKSNNPKVQVYGRASPESARLCPNWHRAGDALVPHHARLQGALAPPRSQQPLRITGWLHTNDVRLA